MRPLLWMRTCVYAVPPKVNEKPRSIDAVMSSSVAAPPPMHCEPPDHVTFVCDAGLIHE